MPMPPQKHIVEAGTVTNASTSQTSFLLAHGVINPDPFSNEADCRAGSILGAMNIQLDVVPNTDQLGSQAIRFDWGIFYNIDDSQTPPSMDDPMGSAGKDLIQQLIHQDGCLLPQAPTAGTNTGEYSPKSWRVNLVIPRAWSKINRGDTIRLYYKFNNAHTTLLRIRVIYKEYFP